ncbi:hypothetical protein [Streptomyces lydicus]|uniref:hypothetical protein n=1 Tax=Streptomyces lydicus TaxID=47763 RepID=UPI0036E187B6
MQPPLGGDPPERLGDLPASRGLRAARRRLFDHDNTGLLGWLGGGFGPVLAAYAALVAAGVLLAGWSHTRAKAAGRRN